MGDFGKCAIEIIGFRYDFVVKLRSVKMSVDVKTVIVRTVEN